MTPQTLRTKLQNYQTQKLLVFSSAKNVEWNPPLPPQLSPGYQTAGEWKTVLSWQMSWRIPHSCVVEIFSTFLTITLSHKRKKWTFICQLHLSAGSTISILVSRELAYSAENFIRRRDATAISLRLWLVGFSSHQKPEDRNWDLDDSVFNTNIKWNGWNWKSQYI